MNKLMMIVILSIVGYCADSLDVKILREVNFSNGYGIIEAEPILKGVKEKVKLRGDYNTEKNGNVNFSFSKVEVDGRIYTLSEPFVKKSRLKNPKTAKLAQGSKIQITDGSKNEILDILNRKRENQVASNQSKPTGNKGSSDSQSKVGSDFVASTGRNTYSSNAPYYYGIGNSNSSNTNKDYSSSTTNKDGTCKAPSIQNGVVSVYSAIAGTCKLLTASEDSIYTKVNQPTCQNIVDYENGEIKVGEEKFVTMDDNKEYKVGSCAYTEPIKLSSEIGTCRAVPDYQKGEALIQKQFFYIRNNERNDVGGCVPTKEYALLEDDVNACKYRYDFINNQAIKQTQYFFMAENARHDVGECIDKVEDGFKYQLFEDDSTCDFYVSNDRVFYKKRLAFMDITGGKQFATDCRVVASNGHEILEEFAGYEYLDGSKQAIRKINQYFIVPGTQNTKKYVAKDVKTNKAYPYQEKLCKWEHDDEKKISKRLSTLFFQDTDENKETIIHECKENINTQITPYAYLGEERKHLESLKNKTLIPEGDSWKIYGTENLTSNSPNPIRNIDINGSYTTQLSCNQAVNQSSEYKNLSQEQKDGIALQETLASKEKNCHEGSETSCSITSTCLFHFKTKPNYGTNQTIIKEEIEAIWIRGDGTRYKQGLRIEWRAQ